MNNKLNELIFTQTADLKERFLIQIKDWANNEFTGIEAKINGGKKTYSSFFEHLTPEERRNAWASRTAEAHRAHRSYENAWNAAERIVRNGREAFIAFAEKNAVESYESACLKLAARIEKKGMNVESIVIKRAEIGVNIETTFTDGEKTVRAFTIIASGEIQKPHYRYLIK